MDSMSLGTASIHATAPAAVVTQGGLETRFGTQNFKLSSGNTYLDVVPEDRPYWKKTGGPGTPDLFLFYANSNRWLISTKLTALWTTDAAGDGIVPGDNFISSPDGFVVASSPHHPERAANAQSDWSLPESGGRNGWVSYMTQYANPQRGVWAPGPITTTASIWSYNAYPTKINDTSPTQDEINAAISGASLTPEQEAVMRRDKIGNRRKNTMLKILGREEVAGSSGWPATSPTIQKGLPFVDGPSGGADNEKWISMNKIGN
jgi:hypothetical protein